MANIRGSDKSMHINAEEQKRTAGINVVPFDLICEAAKTKDVMKLIHATSLADINVWNRTNIETPVFQLAAENDRDSVDFLLKYKAPISFALGGFAFGGYQDEVLEKLKKIEPKKLISPLENIAYGFARGGHKTKAYDFLNKVKEVYPVHTDAVVAKLAFGFAYSGDETEAYKLLELAKHSSQCERVLGEIASGFAFSNKRNAYRFLERVTTDYLIHLPSVLKAVAIVLARVGNTDEVYLLLETVKKTYRDDAFVTVIRSIASGYAYGGHGTQAVLFLKYVMSHYPNQFHKSQILILNGCSYSFLCAGHIAEAFAYLGKVKTDFPNCFDNVLFQLAVKIPQMKKQKLVYVFLDKVKSDYPDQFIAVLGHLATGFALDNQKENLYELIYKVKRDYSDALPSVLRSAAYGFASAGHKSEAFALQNEYAQVYLLNNIADGFANGNYKKEAYAIIDKVRESKDLNGLPNLVATIAEREKQNNRCIDKAIVLKTLTMVEEQNIRTRLVNSLIFYVNDYNLNNLLRKAERFNLGMRDKMLSYDQLMGWIHPEMQIFLLQAIGLVKSGKITVPLFRHIATFISPMTLPEVTDLSNKFYMQIRGRRFFENLKGQGVLLGNNDMSSSEHQNKRQRK